MKRSAPIAAVLALGLAGTAHAEQPCASEGTTVQVATLNAWGLPYPLSRDRRGRFSNIERFLDRGLDVVGLQEVWTSARGLLLNDLRLPAAPHDSGLAVVTPYASTQPVLERFHEARGVDAWKSKGVLSTKVQLPDGEPTWVVVTHMQAGGSEKAAKVRRSQVDQLMSVVERLDGPAMVMGDFNLYEDLADDRTSTAKMEAAGWSDARKAGADRPTYPGSEDHLDRIYVRGGKGVRAGVVDAAVGRARGLSDHRPVQATVALCRAE